MTCDGIKPLISEYADDRLASAKHAQVQAHLAHCPACARLAQDIQTMSGLLRGLPSRETSPGFDAALAERLAQARAASRKTRRHALLNSLLRPQTLFWRPAVALGAAAAAIGGFALYQHPVTPQLPQPPVPEGLVTHCIQQHRSYVAGQPLSDIAAQNLANQLDDGAGTAAASSEEATL